MIANGYLLNAWLSFIIDCEKVPYIIIALNVTDRQMSVPMEFAQGEFLTLSASPSATGYFSIDNATGYLSMSARFNGISRDMLIPLESIVLVRSKCGTVAFDMPSGLIEDHGSGVATPPAPSIESTTVTAPKPPVKQGGFKPTLVATNTEVVPSSTGKKPTLTVVK